MRLRHLWMKGKSYPDYEVAVAFVVRAETEEQARTLASHRGGDEVWPDCNPWLFPEHTECVPLEHGGKPGIVLRHYIDG